MCVDLAIIGGGISGLTAAYRMSRNGVRVELLEAEGELGGLLRCVRRPGYRLERLYHHLFEQDADALELIAELGLEKNIVWRSTRTGFYHNGQWFDVSNPLSLLRFRPLRFRERLRLGRTLWQAKKEKSPERLDGLSVSEWLGLEDGSRMAEVFDGLVRGKFGIGPGEISAAFLCGRFRSRARRRSLLSRDEKFGYLRGSLQRLIDRLAEEIEKAGGKIRTGARVTRVEERNGRYSIKTSDGLEASARGLLSTIAPHSLGEVTAFLSPKERKALSRVGYAGVICICCGLDRSLSPFYWGTIHDGSLPFLVAIEQTRFHRPEGCAGEHIVYIARYTSVKNLGPDGVAAAEEEMLAGLERICSVNGKPRILWHHTSIFKEATPIYGVGFADVIRHFPKAERLWMTGAAFTYPDSRNINSMVRAATGVAGVIRRYFEDERQ